MSSDDLNGHPPPKPPARPPAGPMMRLLAAVGFGIAASVAALAPVQAQPGAAASVLDPQRLELARQIIDIAYPADMRRAMLMRAGDTMMAQGRAAMATAGGGPLDAGAERIVERFFDRARAQSERAVDQHASALFDSYARAYARAFTAGELKEIRAFVATPAGAKYVQRSPELLSDPDVARANSAYMATAFAGLPALQADLRRELTEYYAKNAQE